MFAGVLSPIVLWVAVFVIVTTMTESEGDIPYIPKRNRSRMKPKICKIAKVLTCTTACLTRRIWDNGVTTPARQYAMRIVRIMIPIEGVTAEDRKRYRKMYHTATQYRTRSVARTSLRALAVMVMSAKNGAYANTVQFDTDSSPVGIDSRCSGCISHQSSDFIGELRPCNRAIKGFGGTRTTNIMTGTLVWRWEDDEGRAHRFHIPNSYYVPQGGVRLLSPQHWAKHVNKSPENVRGTGSDINSKYATLYWEDAKYSLTVPLGEHDNVATFNLAPGFDKFEAFCVEIGNSNDDENPIADPMIVSDNEDSIDKAYDSDMRAANEDAAWREPGKDTARPFLTLNPNGPSREEKDPVNVIVDEEERQESTPTAELLKMHYKFGHVSFAKLKEMAAQGIIPRRLEKAQTPACTACLYAKATKRRWRDKTSNNKDEAQRATKPGEVVSVDQLVSPTPGLVAQISGFLTRKRYKYATVFVDQCTGYGYAHLQKSDSAEETLEAKTAWEKLLQTQGITVRNYHADNGIFKAMKWVEACTKNGQGLTYAAVGAHHQNGVAEKRIRDLQELTRSMMIHANKRWKKSITAHLWPYALRMAVDAINDTPSMQDKQRRTPSQRIAMTKVDINPKHYAPFGCPVYVLDSALQSNQPHHKWKERARVGIYLGKSQTHARNVALVLDRNTGHVSPQFHVKFDPYFNTVREDEDDSQWQAKTGLSDVHQTAVRKRDLPERVIVVGTKRPDKKRRVEHADKQNDRPSQQQNREPPTEEAETRNNAAATGSLPVSEGGRTSQPKSLEEPQTSEGGEPKQSQKTTRSGRTTKPIQRLIEAMQAEITVATTQTPDSIEGEIFALQAIYPDITVEQDPLLAFKATADPDTMYMHEAMKEPDAAQFTQAMLKEVADHIENNNFSIVHKSTVPSGHKVLPMVWQMKRKRDIKTRKVKKWKARLNIDGSKMREGVHYDQTYSPVASWNSIRMLLALAARHNWHTQQIDFVLAFTQAPIERELYLKIPRGFEVEGVNPDDYVLKAHKNIYGQKQAGRVWNKYLHERLLKIGFKQSKVDECIYYRGSTIYALYTDDSILAGPDKEEIDRITHELRHKAKLDITVEGDIQDFLGVNIERQDDGTIKLTQPHLIDAILKDLRLDNDPRVKPKPTPASSSKLLSRHTSSESFDKSFDYRSVIGKLNYLERATRCDISYIVHQCARFSADPKVEHAKAVRWLGRYLLGTRDKGIILKPDDEKDLEVHCDADFAGNWDPKEAATDRDTARSRHGYIISYAGCPVVWKSQMQTEIALSSTESEYNGISYALREAIPLMELLREMKALNHPIGSCKPQVRCKLFEDNSGALEIANVHKFRPRTKHINVKLHHFRDYVTRKEIEILPIRTTEQPADFLTKPLNEELMKKHRLTVMGW